jgi:hypothetical protein
MCTEIFSMKIELLFSFPLRRLHDNQFVCDCRLLWLAKYLKSHPFLGLNARCQDSNTLSYKDITLLIDDEKQCNSMGKILN